MSIVSIIYRLNRTFFFFFDLHLGIGKHRGKFLNSSYFFFYLDYLPVTADSIVHSASQCALSKTCGKPAGKCHLSHRWSSRWRNKCKIFFVCHFFFWYFFFFFLLFFSQFFFFCCEIVFCDNLLQFLFSAEIILSFSSSKSHEFTITSLVLYCHLFLLLYS